MDIYQNVLQPVTKSVANSETRTRIQRFQKKKKKKIVLSCALKSFLFFFHKDKSPRTQEFWSYFWSFTSKNDHVTACLSRYKMSLTPPPSSPCPPIKAPRDKKTPKIISAGEAPLMPGESSDIFCNLFISVETILTHRVYALEIKMNFVAYMHTTTLAAHAIRTRISVMR